MRHPRTRRTSTLALGALLVSAAPAAAALLDYDLTGDWTGKITCSAYVGGVKQKIVLTPTMHVSQVGQNIGVSLEIGLGGKRYAGLANPDAKKPEQKGETALILCGTDNVLGATSPDEIGRMSVAAKPGKVKATLKGLSFYSDVADHGTCKWSMKRISTTDPGVDTACSTGMLQTGAAQ